MITDYSVSLQVSALVHPGFVRAHLPSVALAKDDP